MKRWVIVRSSPSSFQYLQEAESDVSPTESIKRTIEATKKEKAARKNVQEAELMRQVSFHSPSPSPSPVLPHLSQYEREKASSSEQRRAKALKRSLEEVEKRDARRKENVFRRLWKGVRGGGPEKHADSPSTSHKKKGEKKKVSSPHSTSPSPSLRSPVAAPSPRLPSSPSSTHQSAAARPPARTAMPSPRYVSCHVPSLCWPS